MGPGIFPQDCVLAFSEMKSDLFTLHFSALLPSIASKSRRVFFFFKVNPTPAEISCSSTGVQPEEFNHNISGRKSPHLESLVKSVYLYISRLEQNSLSALDVTSLWCCGAICRWRAASTFLLPALRDSDNSWCHTNRIAIRSKNWVLDLILFCMILKTQY